MTEARKGLSPSEINKLKQVKRWLRSKAGKQDMVTAVNEAKVHSEKHKEISVKHEKALRNRPVMR
ncbi:MAG: hypothetical protein KKF77_13420 [Proteobacteria bacterium]|nr:hypothetical protein [Pseudomonadota bacterium]